MTYEVRRTGDGGFYLVEVDERGISKEIYENGKLHTFDSSDEAKEFIKLNYSPRPVKKGVFTRR